MKIEQYWRNSVHSLFFKVGAVVKLGELGRRGQFYLPVKQTMKFSSQRPINDSFYGYGTHQLGDKKAKLDLLTSVKDFFFYFPMYLVYLFSRPVWQLVALKKKKKKEKVVLAWAHILKSHSQQTFHSEQLDPLLQPSSKVWLLLTTSRPKADWNTEKILL